MGAYLDGQNASVPHMRLVYKRDRQVGVSRRCIEMGERVLNPVGVRELKRKVKMWE